MSDEETRQKRKNNYLRNKHAKELKENKSFRIRRVEDKTKLYRRYKSNEIINQLDRFLEDDNEE